MKDYHFGTVEGILREKAVKLHHQRYYEVGYFKENDVDPYEECATYFVAQSVKSKEIVGVTRLIYEELHELPTMKNFNIYDIENLKLSKLDKNKVAEVSAFTKMKKHDVGLAIIKTVLNYSLDQEMTHWICCIDERVYNYMHRIFKFPFEVIGEPQVYLGSKSIPCLLNLSQCLIQLKEKRRPLYDYFVSSTENSKEVVK